MKTIKHALLVVLMLASFSNTKAQCNLWTLAYTNGTDVQCYAHVDSSSLPTTYYWEFGDGDTAQDMSPSHTYTSTGTYNVCFHYTSFLCTGDTCYSVLINACDFNPQIAYTANGFNYTFSGNHTADTAAYYWQVIDEQFNLLYDHQYSDTSSLNYTFANYGYYYIRLLSNNGNGLNPCYDSTDLQIYIPNPCHAYFNYGNIDSTTLQFYASPNDSTNPGQFSYSWSFGDGTYSSLYAPSHDFTNYGTYNVCLTVNSNVCADTICQQINIAPPPPPAYNIYGHLSKGGASVCASQIFLISDSAGFLSLVNTTFTVDSAGLSCNGNYHFYGLPQGTYYVKAALDSADADYANYLPTYYGNVLNWSNATPVTINTNQYNVDINLIAGVNPGGPGFIGGWVSQGAGLTNGGNNESRATGDPLPNIQINLVTINDVPVASTYTDANGRYTFNNLAYGTYKVYAEEINKIPFSMTVTLAANNPSQDNVNVSVNSNSAVTGIDNLRDITVEGVYPNPISDKATVTVSLQQNSKMRMTLTDVNGRLLQSKNLNLSSGATEIQIDLSSEPAGICYLSLLNDTNKKIVRLVKIR